MFVSLEISMPFSSNQLCPPPPCWWLIVCFNAFYHRLIAGEKALLLLFSPVVAVLSLSHPPPHPLPPSLADHDLGQGCVVPAAIDLVCSNLTVFVMSNRARNAAKATVSA
jgi:hypothetical protein